MRKEREFKDFYFVIYNELNDLGMISEWMLLLLVNGCWGVGVFKDLFYGLFINFEGVCVFIVGRSECYCWIEG